MEIVPRSTLIRFTTDRSQPPVLKDDEVKKIAARMAKPLTELCKSGEALLFTFAGVEAPSERKACD